MDVKTAFLNGKLEEDVYMTQPEGFVTPGNAEKVYDILIIGNDIPTLQSVKTGLSSCFSMKDLGEAAYILGVRIYRDRSRRLLDLNQSTYIDKVLKRFSMEESNKGLLPTRHGISLSKEMCPSTPQERERMSKIPYASTVGSIMCAMICTRPVVSYALSMTSQYQANHAESHWIAVINILKYLRRTKNTFLVYGGEEKLSIKGYTDASFQTDKDDSRSQYGFVFCLNGGAVSWKGSKQDTVADSTTEAEYIVASEAAKEVFWIKKFISELGVVPSMSNAIELCCGNNRAIAQAKEPRYHQLSKHILRHFHLIREIIDRGDVEICKVHTNDNIVDPLTKPLEQQKHDRHTKSLGIRYILFIFDSSYFLHSNSGEKSVERNIYLFDIERVELKKWKNAVHVRDQKHELTPPGDRANPRGPRFNFNPEIERTQKHLKRRIRSLMERNNNNGQPPADGQGLPAQADGAIAPPIPQINQQPPVRTVRDYLAEDLERLNHAVTMPEFEAEHFELKPVIWKSSKQDTVVDSTPEAEHIAASEAAKEVVWIKKFITELGVIPSISDALDLYYDNNGAIAQAKEPRSHQRSKHIHRCFHLIREIIDRGDMEICKVHTDDNIADPLMKPLAQQKHNRHTKSLGIRYVSDWS
ncbi:hypothetical protein GQ457_08G024350 [Hibiscus cannabinus]